MYIAPAFLAHMIEPPTRLRRAILTSSLPLVTRLIRTHPSLLRNPDFTDKSNTSLHLAAIHNFVDIAQHLIQAGHEDGLPSSLFPGFDYCDTLEEISRNTDHETPLMLAARHSSVEVGRLLVKHFPGSVTMRNQRGLDALMIACQNPASTALVPVFLQSAGLEIVNGRDLDGNTPLHHASASGSLKALRILLGSGANPMAANAHNWSPLSYSQTVAAEVYFKNLVVELEKRKVEGAKAEEEGRKQKAGGLRVVGPDEEGGGGGVKAMSVTTTRNGDARKQEAPPMTPVDDEEVIGDALKRHWSPTIERKRPITPGSGGKASILSHDWDSRLAQSRSRSYSGD